MGNPIYSFCIAFVAHTLLLLLPFSMAEKYLARWERFTIHYRLSTPVPIATEAKEGHLSDPPASQNYQLRQALPVNQNNTGEEHPK